MNFIDFVRWRRNVVFFALNVYICYIFALFFYILLMNQDKLLYGLAKHYIVENILQHIIDP